MSPTDEDRFWAKVDKTPGFGRNGDCWEWQGGQLRHGYGRFSVGQGEEKAHRYSYALAKGSIPDGMIICHHCDNPPCVNPSHLFLGEHQDNSDDKLQKMRHRYGDNSANSKLTEDQVRAIIADPRMQIEIAAAYGITQGNVGHIKRGTAWRHIPRG
tara:strand:+ start:22667 stop:23134 length:468 start_codon:yes stop_codon:yes gene_type:complete